MRSYTTPIKSLSASVIRADRFYCQTCACLLRTTFIVPLSRIIHNRESRERIVKFLITDANFSHITPAWTNQKNRAIIPRMQQRRIFISADIKNNHKYVRKEFSL